MFFAPFIVPALLATLAQAGYGSSRKLHARAGARSGLDTLTRAPNATVDIAERAADTTKYVFMHHIVGSKYPYVQSDWNADIAEIGAKEIDAIALNFGSDSWQKDQMHLAFKAAEGTSLKLFLSFDYTAFDCSVSKTLAYMTEFKSHPNYFYYNGKPFLSSYGGGYDCLGVDGWKQLQNAGNYLMPFMWELENRFSDPWGFLDSWFCWGCAYPQSNEPKNTLDDQWYYSMLGSRYATTASSWMFTHYSWTNKNFYLRGDDWLGAVRWEQLMGMRDQLTFTEIITWNDWGESNYYGPFRYKDAQPTGTYWAEDFPHTALWDMTHYYITAFKTGQYPTITEDVIYFWARPHFASVTASSDSLGPPNGQAWAQDFMWAVAFSTDVSDITLCMGASCTTFTNQPAGVNKLKIPLAAGKMSVKMVKRSVTVIDHTEEGFVFNAASVVDKYNYNCYAGSAKATSATSTTATSATSVTTSTATSTSASSASGLTIGTAATSTSASTSASTSTSASGLTIGTALTAGTTTTATTTAGTTSTTATTVTTSSSSSPTWTSQGCIAEGTTGSRRALNGINTSSDNMTPTICQAFCAGYDYAGVEYGRECYCGNTLTNNGASGLVADAASCDVHCSADSSAACGGTWFLSLYATNGKTATQPAASTDPSTGGWTSLGCVDEGSTGSRRALTGASFSEGGMTPSRCNTLCAAYTYAGTEYGTECYCGNTIQNNGASGKAIDSSRCDSKCGGDSSLTCGGTWTMSVWGKQALPGTTTASTTDWTSNGCYSDSSTRLLRDVFWEDSSMTTELCKSHCTGLGYKLAATEYGSQCLCGNTLYYDGGSGTSLTSDRCNSACQGNTAQSCGGSWTANLYTAPASTPTKRREVQSKRAPRTWQNLWGLL
ncbi:glycoside hydrolase family 71 protein [Cylindrobasidium torrendii FP15055 ss-10]|uniref:Glycoside hydrolase family 71 protein n=1 Tax=Cylindrobasidium torrendii FP15055 ss-10 TaxID=1314674 RepID=A0A0D7AVN9_9AGAR|nr:glycoside hydrolase family 71 protein [Cylindrobasidium torrendii FP15055 ss-10]